LWGRGIAISRRIAYVVGEGGYLFDLAGNSTTGGAWKKGMIQTNLSRILLID
jgi:hypothetical protein